MYFKFYITVSELNRTYIIKHFAFTKKYCNEYDLVERIWYILYFLLLFLILINDEANSWLFSYGKIYIIKKNKVRFLS